MTTTAERAEGAATVYEVVIVDRYGEETRTRYEDFGDGSWLAKNAEVRAARTFLQIATARVPVSLYVNGLPAAGEAYEIARERGRPTWEPAPPAPVEHKTRTYYLSHETGLVMRPRKARVEQLSRASMAVCSCGWETYADTRERARLLARKHREEAAGS